VEEVWAEAAVMQPPGYRKARPLHLGEVEGPMPSTATANTSKTKSTRRWSASVTTDSTYPPPGLFNKSAAVVARTLASKKVSPKGPSSGMRMLTFYINRAGHNLTQERRAELEKAKGLLSARIAREKKRKATSRPKGQP
jgi:tRNA(adenine34) deaminase